MPCRRLAMFVLLVLAAAPFARAAEPLVIRLWPGDPPATQPYDATDKYVPFKTNPAMFEVSEIKSPSMAVYLPTNATGPVPAFVICPGGGYAFESVTNEGTDIVARLNAAGIAGIILKYRLPTNKPPLDGELPLPQQDVFRAIQVVRSHAAEWKLNDQQIGVMGFSAGGHLAASAVTMFGDASTLAGKAGNDAISKLSARPDFGVLVYPVITLGDQTHGGTVRSLIGWTPTPELIARYSTEQHVTADTPPLFILHAEDDHTVPVANSIMMASAAAKAKVPCELILLHTGGHGFGLGKAGSEASHWFDAMLLWLKTQPSAPAAN